MWNKRLQKKEIMELPDQAENKRNAGIKQDVVREKKKSEKMLLPWPVPKKKTTVQPDMSGTIYVLR